MKEQFRAISVSYKTSSVEVREKVALNESEMKSLLSKMKDMASVSEGLILSTCNRTEIYYSAMEDKSEELKKLLWIEKGLQGDASVLNHFICLEEGLASISHLFRVSLGLEAQVVGDMQISNQVKKAYQASADEEMAGPFLHRLMHTIFFSSKRVVQETSFRDGAASVSYASVELIEELSETIIDPKILVLGVGEMGEDVCKNLVGRKYSNVTVMNRTHSKAVELAAECGFRVADFENLQAEINQADIVVSAVPGNEGAVIDKSMFASDSIAGVKYFIDMSVPRSVDPAVEEIQGVLLFGIDQINNRTNEALKRRKAAIPQVEAIVTESIAEFEDWSKEMEVSPTIHKLKVALEKIRTEEISRHLKQLSGKESDAVEMITKNIMQKIIKLPVLQLKAACKRGEAETLIDVLNDLFNLEKVEEATKK